jgi:hypothetical protein
VPRRNAGGDQHHLKHPTQQSEPAGDGGRETRMPDIKVQCCRCKNKHMESERLKVPSKKYGSGVSDMICPRCRCTTYYRLQAE